MRAIKYNGKLMTFAGKILRMAEWVYQEGVHYLRVVAGGGVAKDRNLTEDIYKMEEEYSFPTTVVGVLSESGRTERASGIYRFVSKLFSLAGATNDVVQATANSQPYLFKKGIKNPNGGTRFMTHPTVSFAADEAWSVSMVFRWNGTGELFSNIIGDSATINGVVTLRENGNNLLKIQNSASAIGTTNRLIGKIKLLTIVQNNNLYNVYLDGVLYLSLSQTLGFEFQSIMRAFSGSRPYHGSFFYYFIRSGALTPTQITAEYNLLSSYFPEISTVQVGELEVATDNCEMVATPKGNVISQNDLAANIEKITNAADREFSSDTGWWAKGPGTTINDAGNGMVYIGENAGGIYTTSLIFIAGRTYRIRLTVLNSNNQRLDIVNFSTGISIFENIQSNGAKDLFFKPSVNLSVRVHSYGFRGNIDDFSIQEVGFAGAADLYTAIYNQTSGTVAQKTLAALKAAAMWRSPDSDLDKQAVFGKLFNGYAVDLLKMDIDTYNAENPTAPWGYHIATRADLDAIATELGGEDVAGMKMKETGTDYWLSDNGDNTSGVSLLGSGLIDENGNYVAFNEATGVWTSDAFDGNNNYVATVHNDLDKLIIE